MSESLVVHADDSGDGVVINHFTGKILLGQDEAETLGAMLAPKSIFMSEEVLGRVVERLERVAEVAPDYGVAVAAYGEMIKAVQLIENIRVTRAMEQVREIRYGQPMPASTYGLES